MTAQPRFELETLGDSALAKLVAARDPEAVRLVMSRNNQRLFRAAWSILKNRAEAEDAVQSAYLSAFAAIQGFEGRSSLSTWLTRIVINEALGRERAARRRRMLLDESSVIAMDEYRDKLMRGSKAPSPDGEMGRARIRELLEQAIAALPAGFRLVFMLREIEGLSIEETAETLGLLPATVKTRHLRARRRLQDALAPELKSALAGAFPFAGAACQSITERVVARYCAGEPAGVPPSRTRR
jgi:RNA polymerase sigma-70 factor (ECF subfamily)